MAIYGNLTPTTEKILGFLKDHPYGMRTLTLAKDLGIPRRTVYNNLHKLRAMGLVENIFPIWRLAKFQSIPLNSLVTKKKLQLHDFSFVVRLIRKPHWWEKRSNKLLRIREQFQPIKWGNNKYPQIKKEEFIIQMFSNTMIFINTKKHEGNDPYDIFIKVTKRFLQVYDIICSMFKFDFTLDGVPHFAVRSQHYVRLKDHIADKCKKEGKGFKLEIDGKFRAWVDFSDPIGVEFGNKDYAVEDTSKYKNFIEDLITHELPLPSESFKMINKVTENQLVFAENQRSHIKAVQDLGNGVKDFVKEIKELRKELNRIKKD